jgi:hypothetical protein
VCPLFRMLFCSSLKIYFVSPLDPCLEISTGGPCFCLPVEIEVIFSCGDQSWKLTFRDESDATVCENQTLLEIIFCSSAFSA